MKNIQLNVSQQRKFEGEVQLQSVGKKPAIKAENLMVGDVMVWNFGSTSKVVEIIPSKTGKTLTVITEYINMYGEVEQGKRRFNADRLVVIEDLNPVVEAEAEAEATVEVEAEAPAIEKMYEGLRKFQAYEITGEELLTLLHKCYELATSREQRVQVKDYIVLIIDRLANGQIKVPTKKTTDQPEEAVTWYEVDVQTYHGNLPASFYTYNFETKEEATDKVNEAVTLYHDYVGLTASIYTYQVTNGVRRFVGTCSVGRPTGDNQSVK